MRQSRVYFPSIKEFPALYLKQVYVEYVYPVLFTCCSDDGGLFLASCYLADGEKKEWVLTQTTPEIVIEMLENRLTIRELFDKPEVKKYIVSLNAKGEYSYKQCALSEIPTEILPQAGYYMDAEPGEFSEEIAELQELSEYRVFSVMQSINLVIKNFHYDETSRVNVWAKNVSSIPKNESVFSTSRCFEQVIAI